MEEKRCLGCMKMIPVSEEVCPFCGFRENYYQTEFYQLPIGCSLQEGRYLVGRVVGEGGFGLTYIGWDSRFGQPVAVKEFYDREVVSRYNTISTTLRLYRETDDTRYRKEKEQIRREALTLKQFSDCRGIVRVEDYFDENNTAYIVMEYVEGITLKQYLADGGGGLPQKEYLRRFRPIVESLCRVHRSGVIHRDISLDNIIMQPDGEFKLLDFGAARPMGTTTTTSITVKYGYAPLEQYQGMDGQGPWTDVYALCVCLYACLTGNSLKDAKERQENDSWDGLGLEKGLKEALKKGLELDYHKRTQSMDELYYALYGERLSPETALDADRENRRRKPLWNKKYVLPTAICMILLCVITAAAVWYARSRPGTWTDRAGNQYEGRRRNGVMEGEGVCSFANGDRYEGGWKEGKLNGDGVYDYVNGDRYEGQFADDLPNGTGVRYWVGGDRYEGEWKDGLRSGEGVFYVRNGDRYEGRYADDLPDGTGVYYWADGDRYEGEWKGGKPDEGTYYYANGDRYEGEFVNGRADGTGVFYYAHGDRYEGEFADDQADGTGTCYYANGDRYEGEWLNGSRNGIGIMYYGYSEDPKALSRYEGQWVNDEKSGTGTMYYVDGSWYEGQWQNDRRSGAGTMRSKEGTVAGQWKNDRLVQENGDGR